MAHVMEMKDGKTATVFGLSDVLEMVEEYAGTEPRRFIEEYVSEINQDRVDFEEQEKYYEGRIEKLEDHQRAFLNDVKEELEAMEQFLDAPRLSRTKLHAAVRNIQKMIRAEL